MEEALYYIHVNKVQKGPFTLEQLRKEGIDAKTMVWKPGMEKWMPAKALPELIDVITPEPIEMPDPPRMETPYSGQTSYGQQNQNPYAGQQPPFGTYPPGWTNWLAWAIVAIVVGVICCGLLGCIPGIVGVVKANSANDAVKRGDPRAYSLNNQAKTWTLVSYGLSGFCLILAIFAFLFLVNAGYLTSLIWWL